MRTTLTCPQGHRWETDTDPVATFGPDQVCPVCGHPATHSIQPDGPAAETPDLSSTRGEGWDRSDPSGRGPSSADDLRAQFGEEPLPGYRLVKKLGEGGF